jgi:hypothetical protein
MKLTLRAALLGGLVIGLGGISDSWAQQARQPDGSPAATAPGTSTRDGAVQTERREAGERSNVVDAAALESGANSFTEGQARARFEDAGFTNLQDLRKDDAGFWRARATQGGASTEIAMDFRGRIASGPGVANLGTASRGTGTDTTGTATPSGRAESGSRPDGTPGNPPSTATGRAVDRMQGETPRPDGTPGNPPGTAAGRALDRATGTNTTGANPNASGTTGGGTTR